MANIVLKKPIKPVRARPTAAAIARTTALAKRAASPLIPGAPAHPESQGSVFRSANAAHDTSTAAAAQAMGFRASPYDPQPRKSAAAAAVYASTERRASPGGLIVTTPRNVLQEAAAQARVANSLWEIPGQIRKLQVQKRTVKAVEANLAMRVSIAPKPHPASGSAAIDTAGDSARSAAEFFNAQRTVLVKAKQAAAEADHHELSGDPVRAQQKRQEAMQHLAAAKGFGQRGLKAKAAFVKNRIRAAAVFSAEKAERAGDLKRGGRLRKQAGIAAMVQTSIKLPPALQVPTAGELGANAIITRAQGVNAAGYVSSYGHGLGGVSALNGLGGFLSTVTSAASKVVSETAAAAHQVTSVVENQIRSAGCSDAVRAGISQAGDAAKAEAGSSFAKQQGVAGLRSLAGFGGTGGLGAYDLAALSPEQSTALASKGIDANTALLDNVAARACTPKAKPRVAAVSSAATEAPSNGPSGGAVVGIVLGLGVLAKLAKVF